MENRFLFETELSPGWQIAQPGTDEGWQDWPLLADPHPPGKLAPSYLDSQQEK